MRVLLPLFALLVAVRLCYWDVLWVDEAYGLAAAQRIVAGEALYTDIWFDKPPLYAWIYALWGARTGIALRLGEALYAALCCAAAMLAARRLFGETEGRAAALLMCFYLMFIHPGVSLPLAPDLLAMPFAMAGVAAAVGGWPLAAGLVGGAALLANAKALLMLPVLLAWTREGRWRVTAGFAVAAALAVAHPGLREQVWIWGMRYSGDTFVQSPLGEGLTRTAGWMALHAAAVIGAGVYWWRSRDRTAAMLALWLLAGLAAAVAGLRFFPRYFFALLPPMVIAASRGWMMFSRRFRMAVLAAALAWPVVRYAPRHWTVSMESLQGEKQTWRDLALFEDCREAARLLQRHARAGDTLFVWGYRPELNVLAGMPAATRFLDSQPLTGVLADRHLVRSDATAPDVAEANRRTLKSTSPTFIADGLGKYNPQLAITAFPDLSEWMARYELIDESAGTLIYRRRPTSE